MAILEIYDLAHPDVTVQLYDNLPTQGVHDFFLPPALVSGVRIVLWSADRPNFYVPVTMYARLRSQALELPAILPVPVASPTPAAAGACLPDLDGSSQDYSRCLPTAGRGGSGGLSALRERLYALARQLW